MKLQDFNYDLPKELIAQKPLDDRSSSKLMIVKNKEIQHKQFFDIIDILQPNDVLVINDTKVDPCQLHGNKETGAKAKFIISKHIKDLDYEVQITSNKVRPKNIFNFPDNLTAIVKEQSGMNFIVTFNKDPKPILEKHGEMPLPPYIKITQDQTNKKQIRQKYQTVYAKHSGSIAAPTAGFHMTPELIDILTEKGISIVKVILHVGYGTFLPVKTEDLKDHQMHEEWIEITKEAATTLNNRRKKLFILGTTALRAIESASDNFGIIHPCKKYTDIFIYPPYEFKSRPDALITNFHLPKSTLLMLVSAFTSKEIVFNAYNEAIKNNYRFFSFGDAMLLFRV